MRMSLVRDKPDEFALVEDREIIIVVREVVDISSCEIQVETVEHEGYRLI